MGTVTKDFSFSEFACPCGSCRFVDGYQIDLQLVKSLQRIRDEFGKAIIISSGIRCPKHNSSPEVGGVDSSYHLLGRAVDVRCTNSSERHLLCKLALRLDLTVGVSKTFLHFDTRPSPIIFLY